MEYVCVARQGPLSVLSGLRISVHPAKPASPMLHLSNQQPTVFVFSAHKIFTTWCAPFPNRIFDFEILRFLILSYFEAKQQNVFHVVRFYAVMLFSFDYPLDFLKTLLVKHYVVCSFLLAWRAQGS